MIGNKLKSWIGNSSSTASAQSVLNSSAAATRLGHLDVSFVGAFFVQIVPVDTVTAEVGGTAVIESASNVQVSSSYSNRRSTPRSARP